MEKAKAEVKADSIVIIVIIVVIVVIVVIPGMTKLSGQVALRSPVTGVVVVVIVFKVMTEIVSYSQKQGRRKRSEQRTMRTANEGRGPLVPVDRELKLVVIACRARKNEQSDGIVTFKNFNIFILIINNLFNLLL